MKWFYVAKSNVFDSKLNKIGEKVLHTSQLFDKEDECRNYAAQYQWNHSCFIEIHSKEA